MEWVIPDDKEYSSIEYAVKSFPGCEAEGEYPVLIFHMQFQNPIAGFLAKIGNIFKMAVCSKGSSSRCRHYFLPGHALKIFQF